MIEKFQLIDLFFFSFLFNKNLIVNHEDETNSVSWFEDSQDNVNIFFYRKNIHQIVQQVRFSSISWKPDLTCFYAFTEGTSPEMYRCEIKWPEFAMSTSEPSISSFSYQDQHWKAIGSRRIAASQGSLFASAVEQTSGSNRYLVQVYDTAFDRKCELQILNPLCAVSLAGSRLFCSIGNKEGNIQMVSIFQITSTVGKPIVVPTTTLDFEKVIKSKKTKKKKIHSMKIN